MTTRMGTATTRLIQVAARRMRADIETTGTDRAGTHSIIGGCDGLRLLRMPSAARAQCAPCVLDSRGSCGRAAIRLEGDSMTELLGILLVAFLAALADWSLEE